MEEKDLGAEFSTVITGPDEVRFPGGETVTLFPGDTTGWQYIGYGIKKLWSGFKAKLRRK